MTKKYVWITRLFSKGQLVYSDTQALYSLVYQHNNNNNLNHIIALNKNP